MNLMYPSLHLVVLSLFLFFTSSFSAQAQTVRKEDILFKKHLVRSVNLRDPENIRLFGDGNNIFLNKILLEAFYKGSIEGYENECFDKKITADVLQSKLTFSNGDSAYQYNSDDLYLIEVGEDFIFNKQRSEFTLVPYSITLFIPSEINHRGILEPVISFIYTDAMKIFSLDERAAGKNPFRPEDDMKYKEIFLTKIYKQRIVKIGSPYDPYIDQIHTDPTLAFLTLKKEEEKIIELVYKLYNPK